MGYKKQLFAAGVGLLGAIIILIGSGNSGAPQSGENKSVVQERTLTKNASFSNFIKSHSDDADPGISISDQLEIDQGKVSEIVRKHRLENEETARLRSKADLIIAQVGKNQNLIKPNGPTTRLSESGPISDRLLEIRNRIERLRTGDEQ